MATKTLRKVPWIFWLCAAVTSSGCTTTFTDPRVPAGEQHSEWMSYFLYGVIGDGEVDVRDHCESGRAHEVRIGENFLTLGASIVTLGIYTPRRVVVTCEATQGTRH